MTLDELVSSGSRGSLVQPGLSVPGCAGRESRDQASGADGLCNLPPLRGKGFQHTAVPLTDLVPFCEQRTGRIICSFAVGHELQGFLQRVIQCNQDRLVKEPCLNSLVVLPEGQHLSLRRETVITQTSSICSTFQWESPKSS